MEVALEIYSVQLCNVNQPETDATGCDESKPVQLATLHCTPITSVRVPVLAQVEQGKFKLREEKSMETSQR